MQTKHIDKLEELINEKWNFNKKKFKLEKSHMIGATVVLHMLNNKENTNGEEEDKAVFWVNEKNYKELEFYGLKVVLNEKPRLSREDKEFLTQDQYFARDENGILWLYHQKPTKTAGFWECANGGKNIGFSTGINHLFPFITWESGKAWSKAELMELEVIDQKGSINNESKLFG